MEKTMTKEITHKSTTHEEMYYHIREAFKFDGKDMQGGTVFFRKDNGKWFYSVARCSANDNWQKRKGRTVARRRFFTTGLVGGLMDSDKPSYEIARNLLMAN